MYGSNLLRRTCVAILLAGLAPWTFAAAADTDYEAGLQAVQEFRYDQALAHFDAAAAHGNRDAMRTAGLMLLYGQDLYGEEVPKDWIKAVHLLSAAAHKGCRVSAGVLQQLGVRHLG